MEYERGFAGAWETVRKVIKLKDIERSKLFDGVGLEWIMLSKSPSEVIQKLKEFEAKGKEKEEETFKAGDVIKQVCTSGSETGIVCVVKSYENGVLCGVTYEGNKVICSSCAERYWKKTGINFKNILMTEGEPE